MDIKLAVSMDKTVMERAKKPQKKKTKVFRS